MVFFKHIQLNVARKNAIKSPEHRWIRHQFTGDVMKYLFTWTDCCLNHMLLLCYGQYYFTSLTLTTPIENGWQDTTNRRQIPLNMFNAFCFILWPLCMCVFFKVFFFNLHVCIWIFFREKKRSKKTWWVQLWPFTPHTRGGIWNDSH